MSKKHPNFIFLNRLSPLSESAFNKLESVSVIREFSAGTQIVPIGEISKKMYMLLSGILRSYIVTEAGKDYTKRIYSPISFAAGLTGLIKEEPSEIGIESLTNCKLFEICFEGFKQLCRENFEIGRLYVRVLENVFVTYENRSLDLLRLDATEMYMELRKRIPNIDDLIPQHKIASYLGVTPVQLSRIRKKID